MKKYLKLFYLAMFASMAMVFTSCGDDDDDEMSSNPLIGTWVGSFEGADDETAEDEVVTMTFTADGTMYAKEVCKSEPEYDWSFEGWYKAEERSNPHQSRWFISLGGYFADDDEYYDDDEEWRSVRVEGNTLYIFFDGSDYRLYRK